MTSPRVAFVLEQTLGHITHAANLRSLVGASDEIRPVFAPIEYDVDDWPGRVPGYGNWTVRAGLRARRAIRAIRRDGPIDAMFVHTQVPAILIPDVLRRIPTVVSLDATPIQYDELGEHYGHSTGGGADGATQVAGQPRLLRRRSRRRHLGRVDEARPRRPVRGTGGQDHRDPARGRLPEVGGQDGASRQ